VDNEVGPWEQIEPELIAQFRQTRASGADQSILGNVNNKMWAAGAMENVHTLG
jgi:hypothetical protein